MNGFVKTNVIANIRTLEDILNTSDIYGCDIKIRNKSKESDWLILTDSQMLELIQSYKDRLKTV